MTTSSPSSRTMVPRLTLFEPFGLGAGGTGAAAGLVHPFAPTGKPVWKADEAFAEAEELISVAERHAGASSPSSTFLSSRSLRMLRPAEDERQAREFARRGLQRAAGCSATPLVVEEDDGGEDVLPGVALPFSRPDSPSSFCSPALVIDGGIVIDPKEYLRHLWEATVDAARAAGGLAEIDDNGGRAVTSLSELDRSGEGGKRRFDVVVLAAGAASGAVREVAGGGEKRTGIASCELARGWTATVAAPPPPSSSDPSPPPSPSSLSFPRAALLGKTYAAPRAAKGGVGGGASSAVVAVGATRDAEPVSASDALEQCSRSSSSSLSGEAEAASSELLARFSSLWPPANGRDGSERRWRVVSATAGVRARPRRSGAGRPPLAGKLDDLDEEEEEGTEQRRNWWVIGGMGSRGLLYSSWIAKEVASAALADAAALRDHEKKNEGGRVELAGDAALDPELTRWKRWK